MDYCVNLMNILQGVDVEWNVLRQGGVLECRCLPGLCVDGWDEGDEFDAIDFDGFGNGEDKVPWISCRNMLSGAWLVVVNRAWLVVVND